MPRRREVKQGKEIRLYRTHAADPPEKAWKQFSALFDLSPMRMPGNSGIIENQTWFAGNNVIAEVSLDGNVHEHHDEHLKHSGDLLFVHRYLSGGADGLSGEIPYMMRPGMFIFHDYGRPFQGIQTPSRLQSIHVPHSVVGYDPERMPPQVTFDKMSEHGRILHAEFDKMFALLIQGAETLKATRLDRVMDKIRAAMPKENGQNPDAIDGAAPPRITLQTYIESNLSNPDLSRESLLESFEISRSELFERFEVFGGVATYIEIRRLFRALIELWKDRETRNSLERVARRWGFASKQAFMRAAKTRYGVRPDTVFEN